MYKVDLTLTHAKVRAPGIMKKAMYHARPKRPIHNIYLSLHEPKKKDSDYKKGKERYRKFSMELASED